MSIKTFRERSPILIGIFSILGITAATTFAFFIDRMPFIKQAYVIKAEFADAAGLTAENQVRVAGIKVGTVNAVELAGDRVLVSMEVSNDAEIARDATAEIKLATLLGTKFVDIETRGDGPFMEDGDTIALADTKVPYEIYQASNQGTAILEDVDGPQLNRALAELALLMTESKEEVKVALDGLSDLGAGLNARQDDLKQLLAGAEDLTALLSDEGDELVRLIDASNEVLGSLARKREEVQSLLEGTRRMAADVTALVRSNRGHADLILARLNRALGVLERNLQDVDMALEYAGPSSRYFAKMFTNGRWGDIYVCALVLTAQCEGKL